MTPEPDFSPLLDGIIARHRYPVVTPEALDAEAAAYPLVLLFLCGDHRRLAESNDVAVVLPELDAALEGHARVLVCAREHEREIQRRYRFTAFPALVFLREGGYLGAIEGIRDWSDYLVEIPEILGREPSAPPAFKLPAGCGESR
ncbi:hydrogenase-1 expression HyaE [Novosphingobium sp. 1949]|uniref:Hydrogenase-1 expression HyaE n=1 Tax=Novosphingobium organovorum TaxID=2930092 RepID=A0ABT0BCL5_9SPHN|nr:hydrogenase-1 expression HyaE [Novosphingobium organovorum]MCJ2182803.1 hydrogenase-1 expression HyaE [Novosphingobium organovorum]